MDGEERLLLLCSFVLWVLSFHLLLHILSIMGDGTTDNDNFTTNAHDLQEAANIQARLSEYNNQSHATSNGSGPSSDDAIPSVSIDEGAYKYVLITAKTPSNKSRSFVYSKRGAQYHRNVAEYLLPQLESEGYSDIRITGGGRILRDDGSKKVHIFGYSYGFGRADHEVAKEVVEKSVNYSGYTVTWSNNGY